MAKLMSKVAERENLLCDASFGLREGRSTVDCIFLLNTALQKARKKRIPLTIASVDLEKAYDMVSRDKLFAKLTSLGYTGKTLSILRSLYFNDNVRININGVLSEPMFFSLGVKQGCSLSPILFALYVDDLVKQLQAGGMGLKIGSETLSPMAFADDILCLSITKQS